MLIKSLLHPFTLSLDFNSGQNRSTSFCLCCRCCFSCYCVIDIFSSGELAAKAVSSALLSADIWPAAVKIINKSIKLSLSGIIPISAITRLSAAFSRVILKHLIRSGISYFFLKGSNPRPGSALMSLSGNTLRRINGGCKNLCIKQQFEEVVGSAASIIQGSILLFAK